MNELYPNLNKLTANSATLTISAFPNTSFTLQHFPLPGISLGSPTQSSPFFDGPVFGDKLYFNDLYLEFQVSEDMKNWYEVFRWMWYIGNPIEKPPTLDLTYVDATMLVYTSHNNPFVKVTFRDCVPISLGDVYFDETTGQTQEISCSLVLKYLRYEVEFLDL